MQSAIEVSLSKTPNPKYCMNASVRVRTIDL